MVRDGDLVRVVAACAADVVVTGVDCVLARVWDRRRVRNGLALVVVVFASLQVVFSGLNGITIFASELLVSISASSSTSCTNASDVPSS